MKRNQDIPLGIGDGMTALAPERDCPSCRLSHPPGTTCVGGWEPWDGVPLAAPVPSLVVTLTDEEMESARQRAEVVVAMDRSRGWKVKFNTGSESRLDINQRGFAAELAAAKATGLQLNWALLESGYKRSQKPPDIGKRTEVRNAIRPSGRLWTGSDSRRDWVYMLVTGAYRDFAIRGWIEGTELMHPDNWMEPPTVRYPGYFARQADLYPLPLPADA